MSNKSLRYFVARFTKHLPYFERSQPGDYIKIEDGCIDITDDIHRAYWFSNTAGSDPNGATGIDIIIKAYLEHIPNAKDYFEVKTVILTGTFLD